MYFYGWTTGEYLICLSGGSRGWALDLSCTIIYVNKPKSLEKNCLFNVTIYHRRKSKSCVKEDLNNSKPPATTDNTNSQANLSQFNHHNSNNSNNPVSKFNPTKALTILSDHNPLELETLTSETLEVAQLEETTSDKDHESFKEGFNWISGEERGGNGGNNTRLCQNELFCMILIGLPELLSLLPFFWDYVSSSKFMDNPKKRQKGSKDFLCKYACVNYVSLFCISWLQYNDSSFYI